MVKSTFAAENTHITAAALRLAGTQGWDGVTLDKIAKSAKLPLAALKTRFKNTAALAPVIAAEIDREAFAAAPAGNTHDRLFDLLMARFDIMQKHRAAILSMADAARHDRVLSCQLARATMDSVYHLLDAAALTEQMPPRALVAMGLTAIYGWAFFAWRKDQSRDMAKTMAAVDRGLRWSGKAVELIKQRF